MVQQARRELARVQHRARWMKIAIFVGAVLGAALVVIKLSNTDFNRLRPVPRDQMNPAEKEKDNIDRRVFEGR